MGSFNKLKDILGGGDNFLLICHQNPDGDAMGSLLAINEMLKNNQKASRMVCVDDIPEVFSFLPNINYIKKDFLIGNFDVIVLLDNGDLKRTGFPERILKARDKGVSIINIDHHTKNDIWKVATVNHVDQNASSTCEIIYQLIKNLRIKITPKMATCLLCGIYTDTGGFQHSNTSRIVLETTADLLNSGASLKKISDNISSSKSISMLKLWGMALNRIFINKEHGIVSCVISKEDIANTKASAEEVSGLVNLLSSSCDVDVALLLHECETGMIKGSLRTEKNNIDVSKIAKLFGGGGHKKAAGFKVDGKIDKTIDGWKIV